MASNPHGLDYKYFERKIAIMHRDGLANWKPGEMARELARMSRTADAAVMHEPEFAVMAPDAALCGFYEVTDYPGLVRELVGHVSQLQESARRNVKPWEDTFPPTLLPAYIKCVRAANAAAKPNGEQLWPGAKIALVIYTLGKPEEDIVLKDQGLDDDEVVSTLRRRGLSIDGDNAYKRDLLDSAVGSMTFGVQNRNPPPAGHWGQRFWDIGREESAGKEELLAALELVTDCLSKALTGGEVSAKKAGAALATASDLIAKQRA